MTGLFWTATLQRKFYPGIYPTRHTTRTRTRIQDEASSEPESHGVTAREQ
jgi:hypothetical protein